MTISHNPVAVTVTQWGVKLPTGGGYLFSFGTVLSLTSRSGGGAGTVLSGEGGGGLSSSAIYCSFVKLCPTYSGKNCAREIYEIACTNPRVMIIGNAQIINVLDL